MDFIQAVVSVIGVGLTLWAIRWWLRASKRAKIWSASLLVAFYIVLYAVMAVWLD